MTTQEVQTITKEIQKIVLKTIAESPTSTSEELTILLKTRGVKVSQDEVLQVIHSISPNKNWHRATQEEVQKEILDYVWTLEAQILFLLPAKQKETTIAEFNQIRLQNKQSKAPKDLIRHIQTLLAVENKNLGKFRKYEKDLLIQNDVDGNTLTAWSLRLLLGSINVDSITNVYELSNLLIEELKEKFPMVHEKAGKTTQRIFERFVEKYFPKNILESKLKESIINYQSIYNTYKQGAETELSSQNESHSHNKTIQNIVEQLKEVQEIVLESHEGGTLSKLFTIKIKNKEGVIKKIDEVINSLNEITDLNYKTNKISNEKLLLVQKLQSDYENIVLLKSQLENDLYNLKEKFTALEEKNANIEKELQNKTESLEKAHEKIASLQQKINGIPELDARANMLREELNIAKDIALRLYLRVNKIKVDLLKQPIEKPKNNEKPKVQKTNGEQKPNGNSTIHKFQQDPETGQTIITTEVNSSN